ncbi:MAG: DUF2961 domain-containing protein [Paludisphaera borealis]|uniref:glycoside hydrolase family 172 protein n=1 Tax=Paludisphaera borealis TaxID=1387353 RepID=UPI002843CCCF|nr:DUF2961 domain-containing protein [Paludisphaera borealis]MDR3621256.1 DUF2961 domain-containing protein [Paludisphaera borealis]
MLFLAVAGLFATAAAPARADDAPKITVESLLRKMVDLSWLAQPPAAGERSVLFSSYDRASKLEGDTIVNPFANGDRGHYLRVEGEGDHREWVLAESKGPGYVSRIWSANPDGELRIYIDGADKPVFARSFASISDNALGWPFPAPFGHVASRGHNLYFPFPFAKSIKITTTKGDQYYQVNVTTLPEGTQVESYSPEVRDRASGAITSAGHALTNSQTGEDVAALMASQPFTLKPGQSTEIVPTRNPGDRPGVITNLACMVTPSVRGDDLNEVLARTLLTITFDDAATPQIAAPLGDFFGAAPGADYYQTYAASGGTTRYQIGGNFYLASSRWIMPYRRSARIVLKNQSTHEARFVIRANVREDPSAAGMLQFHARWRSVEELQTKKGEGTLDWPALRVKGGAGRFVGLLLNVYNPVTAWWGEGDEKIHVDGEKFPSTFGTGTEDYFGYAWGDSRTYMNPFHAQTRCDGPGSMGNTSNIRHQILDSVPFRKSLDFDLEVWHWEAVKMQYATLAYFYAAPGATIEPGVPDLSTRKVHPKPPVKREPGAIEAEDLRVRDKTAGDTPIQDMTPFGDAWSGAQQLFWIVREPGARLDLEVRVEQDGTYALWGGFTKAPDYAMVQLALDGKDLGRPIDLYAPGVVHSGAAALGVLSLETGTHVLSLTIAGKNPKSTSYLVGLDWLKLAPTQTILPAPIKPRR